MTEHGGNQIGVLIFDDDPGYRRLMESELRGLGITRLFGAATEKEAMEILIDRDIDAMVIEWFPDFVRFLKSRTELNLKNIAVVMATSRASKDDVVEAMKCGIDAFIAKPFSAADLGRQILGAIEKCRPVEI